MKKKVKQASRIRMPKKVVKKPQLRRKPKFSVSNVFKKRKSKYDSKRKKPKNLKILILPLVIFGILGLIYLTISYVTILRERAFGEKDGQISEVLGLENIPTYPNSTFIFTDNMDDPVVKDFLSRGNSAYRLPEDTTIEEIESYYMNTLKDLKWEFVQSVPLGTPDRKYGQYWINGDKGLRIYSKYNDIWYESISVEDAKNALANLVKEEIEREMLMASSEKQDLLPDYPWKIQVPKEYIIKYSPTDMKDLRAVTLQKMGSSEIVEIYPVGYWKAKELDYFILDYCKIKSTQEYELGVLNSIPISFRDTLGLKSSIEANSVTFTAYTVPNDFNYVVYVISSNSNDNPLLEYILENIQPLGAKE